MNIHDTIKATYQQWQMMAQGATESEGYIGTGGETTDNIAYSHMCDYDDEHKRGTLVCENCLMIDEWKAGCLVGATPYRHWLNNRDTKPMLEAIKRTAAKYGVELDD